ncbi:MAG: bifunctional hydroxymethylpyrimidine kinase/phosphomethylpyrimidine kinase [Sphingomonas sp.]|nr:bifunctional hydroxymethylpyrimidine kinase/phosphomethylpyrimidine kinase [Sphingomonas sp.]
MTPPRVLIIAGSDSGGGAGIQADIKAVTMLGGFAMTAITALTAQNTLGVEDVFPVPEDFLLKQVKAVDGDLGIDVVKIGMLATPELARTVGGLLKSRFARTPVVLDPVMVATSGDALNDIGTIDALREIAPHATVITPNIPELGALVGTSVTDEAGMRAAALTLSRQSGRAVLAKGGHLPGDELADLLAHPDGRVTRWSDSRIDTKHTHGTGCTLASALAAGLGAGLSLDDAVARARVYVRAAILAAPGFGRGNGPMGHALGVVPFDAIRG